MLTWHYFPVFIANAQSVYAIKTGGLDKLVGYVKVNDASRREVKQGTIRIKREADLGQNDGQAKRVCPLNLQLVAFTRRQLQTVSKEDISKMKWR